MRLLPRRFPSKPCLPRLLTLALLLPMALGCRAIDDPSRSLPTTIFAGGPIVTLDEPLRVEALAIRGAEIAAVGGLEELQRRFPDARRVDLEGRSLLPGFLDTHAHVHELGRDRLLADLTGAESVDDMVRRLREKFPQPDAGQWLIGQGWDEGAWGSRGYPDRRVLDAAFPDHPVWLGSLHGFAGFANARALEIARVSARTPDPEAGSILRRANGEPTGVLLTLAQNLVQRVLPGDTPETTRAAVLAGLEEMASAGVTTVHEAGVSSQVVEAYERLAAERALPIRVRLLLDGNEPALVDRWLARGPLDDPNGMLAVRGFKIFYDGSLGSRTALLAEPYADRPQSARPSERMALDRMAYIGSMALRSGFQMAVHAIGDEGNDRVLNLFEDLLNVRTPNASVTETRWRIEHAQVVKPDFYSRAAGLGIVASVQPSHAVGYAAWAGERLGPARLENAYAWRRMLDAGVDVVINSDLPGEPWRPLETLYFAITRQRLPADLAGGAEPVSNPRLDQALAPLEAFQAMNLAGAWAGFDEYRLGRLAPGLLADFVELSGDPLATAEAAPEHLPSLSVHRVWIGGRPLDPPPK
ncbi:MAG: amidohydrolase [Acidobacteriota bacterium]